MGAGDAEGDGEGLGLGLGEAFGVAALGELHAARRQAIAISRNFMTSLAQFFGNLSGVQERP